MDNDKNGDKAMVPQATDPIIINAGGILYMTCRSTLLSSGARFFVNVLGQTGTGHKVGRACHSSSDKDMKGKTGFSDRAESEMRISEEVTPAPNDALFLDCDPHIFSDVLHFMRRKRIAPETMADAIRLEKLRIEAEFFSYDALLVACCNRLEAIKQLAKQSLENRPSATSGSTTAYQGDDKVIHVPDGQVLFIVSATLAGECRVRRYASYDDNNNPGCYLNSCEENHSGDFQLHYYHMDDKGRNHSHLRCCIAHVGLDQIHCGRVPLNVNFREDLRLCISPQPGQNWVALGSNGAGTWHVHYWIGHPKAIPELNIVSDQGLNNSKKRKLQRFSTFTADQHNKTDSSVFHIEKEAIFLMQHISDQH